MEARVAVNEVLQATGNMKKIFISKTPIASNLLIHFKEGILTFSATDDSVYISQNVKAVTKDIDEKFELLVDGIRFISFLQRLSGEDSDLILRVKKQLSLSSGKLHSRMAFANAERFPLLPLTISNNPVDMDMQVFNRGLEKVLFVAGSDDVDNYSTSSIVLDFPRGMIYSTDTIRVASSYIGSAPLDSMLMRGEDLAILAKITKDVENISVYANDRQIIFSWQDAIISIKALAVSYPVEMLYDLITLPLTDYSLEIVIDRKELANFLSLCSTFSSQYPDFVTLYTGEDNNLMGTIRAGQDSASMEFSTEISPFEKITFSANSMLSIIQKIKSDRVVLALNNDGTPIVVLDDITQEVRFLHVQATVAGGF